MSEREPRAGDRVWFRPGTLVDVTEDATGKKLYRVVRPDGLDEFFGEGCIDRFEPKFWTPTPGDFAFHEALRERVIVLCVGAEWCICKSLEGREFPIRVIDLGENRS